MSQPLPVPGRPAPTTGQRQPTELKAPLAWTVVFASIGVAAAAVLLVVGVLLLLVLLFGSWGQVAESGPSGVFDVLGLVVLVALDGAGPLSVAWAVASGLSVGTLVLLRRFDAFRRWRPVLQGLVAAAVTFAGAGTVLPVLADLASLAGA